MASSLRASNPYQFFFWAFAFFFVALVLMAVLTVRDIPEFKTAYFTSTISCFVANGHVILVNG